MQYARPSRSVWVLLLAAGCGQTGMAVPSPDAAAGASPAPDAAPVPDAAAPADSLPPVDLPPAPDLARDAPAYGACSAPETAPLRRLTATQYQRTVRELAGVEVTTALPPSATPNGFDDWAEFQDSAPATVEAWNQAAEEIVTALSSRLPALTGCPGAIDQACASAFIRGFGRRAYRRPLTEAEVAAHLAVFNQVLAMGDASDGVAAVLRVMLQSPHFLYRVEVGGRSAGGRINLSSWEVAARLSYFLWGNMPDAMLFAAAEADKLSTPQQVTAQIERMLADPRARQGTNDFFRQWLSLDRVLEVQKDPATYPAFNDTLAAAMREEGYRFAQHVIFDGDGKLATLLTSTESIVNAPLAQLYGVTITGSGWQPVDLTGKNRMGLFTQGWFLASRAHANESSAARRGSFLRTRLLCEEIPPPPAGVDPPPPQAPPGSTTRQRYLLQVGQPNCAACHQLFDPLGFPFENYDGIGAFRATDNGQPVDASGEITGGTDVDGRVIGAPELLARLAGSTQVADCVATRWYELGLGRRADAQDACRAAEMKRVLRTARGNLRDLVAAIAADVALRPRLAGEVAAISAPLLSDPGRRSMQKIVLDLLSSQVVQLKQRLPLPQDHVRLDQHLEGLRELEKRLQ
jgi:hypothetical protein